MIAGIDREAVVEKSHITDNQYNYAGIAALNVSNFGSRNRQSEKTRRRATNSIRPKLSVANVNWLGGLREHGTKVPHLRRLEDLYNRYSAGRVMR